MKLIVVSLILSLCLASTGAAQKSKKKRRTTRPRPAPEKKVQPPIIGSQIMIITKNGDQIKGELLDLTAYSVRIRANNLESTHALDTIAALSFDSASVPNAKSGQSDSRMHPDFGRDLQESLKAFQSTVDQLKTGTDYAAYGRLLTDFRRSGERFIDKYSASENSTEARAVALFSGALTDYSWARTVWTLKFGRKSDGTVSEADSPAVSDALAVYPDLRAQAASGSRFSGDKIISSLWARAADKAASIRELMDGQR